MRKTFGIAVIGVLVLCGPLHGQVITSTIVGHVADPSGAPVGGANITVINFQTGRVSKAVSALSGTFTVPDLISGEYQVTVARGGFETVVVSGVQLSSSATVRVDVALKVGSITSEVTVVAPAPLVQTDTMTVSGSVSTQQLTDLPTGLLTIDAFLPLTAGFQPFGANPTSGVAAPNIGGGSHWGSTNFTLNGVEVNDPGNSGAVLIQGTGGGLLVLPPPSALQEVSVQSTGMTARYRGQSNVTLVTKGGSNRYHGELYEYLQNTSLNANSFTLNAAGKPRAVDRLNQFGGNFGGPVVRDKAFFFFDYSGYRRSYSVPVQLRLPGAAMRTADFSALCSTFNAGGTCTSGTQLYDPFTGQTFANNQIPASMIAPQSKALLDYLPLPTVAGSPGLPNGPFNYISTVASSSRSGAWDLRIDYNISDKDRLFGVYAQRIADPWGVASANYPEDYGHRNHGYRERSVTLSETHSFGSNMMNELRVAWSEYATKFSGMNLSFDGRSIWPQMPESLFKGLPTITASGYTGLWYDYGSGLYTPRRTVEFGDDFTYIRGRHTIEAGIHETGYKMWNRVPSSSNVTGAFSFNGNWTGNRGWPGLPRSGGNAFADFMLGAARTSKTSATGAYAAWLYTRSWGAYLQDTWQVSPRLTVIYGLRYEYQPPWHYQTQQITTIDLNTSRLVLPQNSATPSLPAEGADPALFSAYPFTTTQSIGLPVNYYQGDKNNFGPRIGVAFRPFGDQRTVVRAGYGVYYNFQPGLLGSGREGFNPPWQLGTNQPFTSKLPGNPKTAFLPDITFANPFPSVNAGSTISANPNINFFQWDFKNAMAQQWNLTLERQLGTNWAVRATYLGNRSTHLPYNAADINRPVQQQPNVALQKQRPYQPWAKINAYLSAGKENFHQLQLGVQKRFAEGLSFQTEYQFTRSLDNVSTAGGPNNPGNFNLDYGSSTGVRRHWMVFNYTYELPFGNKRRWLGEASGLTNALIGGWRVSGITSYGTGVPLNITFSTTGTGIVGWWGGRPDLVSGAAIYDGQQQGHDITSGVQWFNPEAFAPPAKWEWGNAARNMVFGPGYWNWDISAMKSFPVWEGVRLQVRGDFLNAFNHFNLSNPNVSIPDTRDGGTANPNSGKVVSGLGSRIVQLSLKLTF